MDHGQWSASVDQHSYYAIDEVWEDGSILDRHEWTLIRQGNGSRSPSEWGQWSDREWDVASFGRRPSMNGRSSNENDSSHNLCGDTLEIVGPQSLQYCLSETSLSPSRSQEGLRKNLSEMSLQRDISQVAGSDTNGNFHFCHDTSLNDKATTFAMLSKSHHSCCISTAALQLSTQEMLNGTGQWLLGSDAFTEWLAQSSGVFWLTGITGTGKSVLTSMVVRQLKSLRRPQDIVVFYFVDGYYKEMDTTVGILRALLEQMLQHGFVDSHVWNHFSELVASGDRLTNSHVTYFLTKIKHKLDPQQTLYLVLDGLDDLDPSPEGRKLVFDLVDFASQHGSKHQMKCFISSNSGFFAGRHGSSTLRIDLDSNYHTRDDMIQYVHSKVQGRPLLADSRVAHKLSDAFLDSAANSFLYVRLQLDANDLLVCSEMRVDDAILREVVATDVKSMYGHMLGRIDRENHKAATSMFGWVTHVVRPLDSHELLDALENETGIRLDEDEIFSISAGFLTKFGNQVRFPHLSARDFLQSKLTRSWAHKSYEVDEMIAGACLRLLSSFELLQSLRLEEYMQKEQPSHLSTRRTSLVPYARAHWMFHYKRAERKSGILAGLLHESLKQSLLRQAGNLSLDYNIESKNLDANIRDDPRPRPFSLQRIALHVGSRFGFWNLSKLELDMGANPNVLSGPEKRSPLHWAASTGHLDLVHLLLQYGAEINTTSGSGKTALVYAMLNDHLGLVDLLQERSSMDSTAPLQGWKLTSLSVEHATQELRLERFFSDSCTVCDEVETSYVLSTISSSDNEEELLPRIYISGEWFPRSSSRKSRSHTVLSRAAKRGFANVKRLLVAAGNDGAAIESSLNYFLP